MSAPKVSVLVLGYNRFAETTGFCLKSLSDDPEFSSWDLVVVDNGSDAPNRDAFVEARSRYPGMRLIRLEQNAGFPGGMNAGLREARGEIIILVSSDVLVPPGMIGRLADAFEAHPRAGLVGPVTNTAGSEQNIFTEPKQPVAAIIEQGLIFANAEKGTFCLSAYRLDFCCVGMRRTVYGAIGGFDEEFIPGYYDDFDFSLRAKNAGFEILVAENAFVCHEGGGTFGRASPEKMALMKRNKAYFLGKHGRDVHLPHVRDTNLSVLTQYADRIDAGSPPPALRIANRLRYALADQPRSPFKRWRYLRRLAALRRRLESTMPGAVP